MTGSMFRRAVGWLLGVEATAVAVYAAILLTLALTNQGDTSAEKFFAMAAGTGLLALLLLLLARSAIRDRFGRLELLGLGPLVPVAGVFLASTVAATAPRFLLLLAALLVALAALLMLQRDTGPQ
jgi:hypothetical protein